MTDELDPEWGLREPLVRIGVRVRGVVQGVGFRPFVYRLAIEEGLAGSIGNDTDGVTIEVEGAETRVETFLTRLRAETPPLARIDSVTVLHQAIKGEFTFRITSSESKGQVSTGIPADAATCADCLRELFDPGDRRFRYPFLNCTNCGPRFTITRRIPYDRPQTSMATFTMCAACQAEYDDPLNRRFHAQPNACPACGPRVQLLLPNDPEGRFGEAAIEQTLELLMDGKIVAIKGIGGFHLTVDATNEVAVVRLRERKQRYGKPLAVMVRDLDAARLLCVLSPEEEALLTSVTRPIVLARARDGNEIAKGVAPGVPWLGIFLPYAPLQHLLFSDQRVRALVMTSANLSEEPIAIKNDEARSRLAEIADAFLLHDREILQRCDDSVLAVVDGAPQLIRRARGFVPLGLELPYDVPPTLAVGGHLKNVFTLARGRYAYQSQHLGDLENLTAIDFFDESLQHLMHTFEIEPEIVVHDLHPGYMSTQWAKRWAGELGLPVMTVQHHHAHVAGCMVEQRIEGPFIGLSLDGTGYGTDGHIWGGEVLLADWKGFERFAHLEYVPMPGGEAAIREPWRMAVGHLLAAGIDVSALEYLDRFGTTTKEVAVLRKVIERGINTPLTSSCGRLFDAVAAAILQRRTVDYEAQAAIELEGLAVDAPDVPGYTTEWIDGDWERREPAKIRVRSLWIELLRDLGSGEDKVLIAARFHAAMASAFTLAAVKARSVCGLTRVALSGGCMHNRRLSRLLRAGLEAEDFEVYQHKNVSPGDGGLSYGQTAVAAATLRNHNSFDKSGHQETK